MTKPHRVRAIAFTMLSLCVVAAGCGSSKSSSSPTTVAQAGSRGSGPVNVLYAASLVALMDKQIGPAFHTATGYSFEGFPAGSKALATEIKGKIRQGDVFISASPTVNKSLEGAANGDWVSWYATFATSPLVLGYNPRSSFAHALQTMPWYRVITERGILLGRTDPVTDPKGQLTVEALDMAASLYSQPALKALASKSSSVFPEESLVGRLQAGQLDAGFFYSSEAKAAGIPTVPLTGVNLKATYTVTVLNQAPDPAAADAFVAFLLGTGGQAALTADGFKVSRPPVVSGSGLPAGLSSVLPGA
jgi:molybdate/tungstate transport system substrate-binding protein